MAAYHAVTTIADPTTPPSQEVMRRLMAFGSLWPRFGAGGHKVTALRVVAAAGTRTRRHRFRASDGVVLQAVRLRHLPCRLCGVYETIGR